ncbi:MAG: ankyrin repeat domain-containing protein [Sphingobacteriia bacterium]|nr:ankyrin repeat domain-containing protein [Sphingobacteriia bacterium]
MLKKLLDDNLFFNENLLQDGIKLIEAGEDVNTVSKHGDTLIFKAISLNNLKAVEFLIKKGIDLKFLNAKDQTLLHYACHRSSTDIVNLLLIKGADPFLQNSKGELPIILALSNNKFENAKI